MSELLQHSVSNADAIRSQDAIPNEDFVSTYDEQDDFSRRYILNEPLLRLLGDVNGRRILDAGCGEGYFTRLLHRAGATVTGVDASAALIARARSYPSDDAGERPITYHVADLSTWRHEGATYDAVVCNLVLMCIPEWKSALASCVAALRNRGRLVISISHPAFEQLSSTWREHGHYICHNYVDEQMIKQSHVPIFHRPLSTYINELVHLGVRVREVVEPSLPAEIAEQTGASEGLVRCPSFFVFCCERVALPNGHNAVQARLRSGLR